MTRETLHLGISTMLAIMYVGCAMQHETSTTNHEPRKNYQRKMFEAGQDGRTWREAVTVGAAIIGRMLMVTSVTLMLQTLNEVAPTSTKCHELPRRKYTRMLVKRHRTRPGKWHMLVSAILLLFGGYVHDAAGMQQQLDDLKAILRADSYMYPQHNRGKYTARWDREKPHGHPVTADGPTPQNKEATHDDPTQALTLRPVTDGGTPRQTKTTRPETEIMEPPKLSSTTLQSTNTSVRTITGQQYIVSTTGPPSKQQIQRAVSAQAGVRVEDITYLREDSKGHWNVAFAMRAAGTGVLGPDGSEAGRSLRDLPTNGDPWPFAMTDSEGEFTLSGVNGGGRPCATPAAFGKPRMEGRLLTAARSVHDGTITVHVVVEHRVPQTSTANDVQSELRAEGCEVDVTMSRPNAAALQCDAGANFNAGCLIMTKRKTPADTRTVPPPIHEASGRGLGVFMHKGQELVLVIGIYGLVDPMKSEEHVASHQRLCTGITNMVRTGRDQGAMIMVYADTQVVKSPNERKGGKLLPKDMRADNLLAVIDKNRLVDAMRTTGRQWMTYTGSNGEAGSMIDGVFFCQNLLQFMGGTRGLRMCSTRQAHPCSEDHLTLGVTFQGRWGKPNANRTPELRTPKVTRFRVRTEPGTTEVNAYTQHMTQGPIHEALHKATTAYMQATDVGAPVQCQGVTFTQIARAMCHLAAQQGDLQGPEGELTSKTLMSLMARRSQRLKSATPAEAAALRHGEAPVNDLSKLMHAHMQKNTPMEVTKMRKRAEAAAQAAMIALETATATAQLRVLEARKRPATKTKLATWTTANSQNVLSAIDDHTANPTVTTNARLKAAMQNSPLAAQAQTVTAATPTHITQWAQEARKGAVAQNGQPRNPQYQPEKMAASLFESQEHEQYQGVQDPDGWQGGLALSTQAAKSRLLHESRIRSTAGTAGSNLGTVQVHRALFDQETTWSGARIKTLVPNPDEAVRRWGERAHELNELQADIEKHIERPEQWEAKTPTQAVTLTRTYATQTLTRRTEGNMRMCEPFDGCGPITTAVQENTWLVAEYTTTWQRAMYYAELVGATGMIFIMTKSDNYAATHDTHHNTCAAGFLGPQEGAKIYAELNQNREGMQFNLTNHRHDQEKAIRARCIDAGFTANGHADTLGWCAANLSEMKLVIPRITDTLRTVHKAFAKRNGGPCEAAGRAWAHIEEDIRTSDGLARTLKSMRKGVSALCATPDHLIHGGPTALHLTQALVEHALSGAPPQAIRSEIEHPSYKCAKRLRPLLVCNVMYSIADKKIHEAAASGYDHHGDARAVGGLRGRDATNHMIMAELAMDYALAKNTPLAQGVEDASGAYNSVDSALLATTYALTGCPKEIAYMVCAMMQDHQVIVKTAAGTGGWGTAMKIPHGLPQGGGSSGDSLAVNMLIKLRYYDDMQCGGFKMTVLVDPRSIQITVMQFVDDEKPHLAVPIGPNNHLQAGADIQTAIGIGSNHTKLGLGCTQAQANAAVTIIGLNNNDRTVKTTIKAISPPGKLHGTGNQSSTTTFLGMRTAFGTHTCGANRTAPQRNVERKRLQAMFRQLAQTTTTMPVLQAAVQQTVMGYVMAKWPLSPPTIRFVEDNVDLQIAQQTARTLKLSNAVWGEGTDVLFLPKHQGGFGTASGADAMAKEAATFLHSALISDTPDLRDVLITAAAQRWSPTANTMHHWTSRIGIGFTGNEPTSLKDMQQLRDPDSDDTIMKDVCTITMPIKHLVYRMLRPDEVRSGVVKSKGTPHSAYTVNEAVRTGSTVHNSPWTHTSKCLTVLLDAISHKPPTQRPTHIVAIDTRITGISHDLTTMDGRAHAGIPVGSQADHWAAGWHEVLIPGHPQHIDTGNAVVGMLDMRKLHGMPHHPQRRERREDVLLSMQAGTMRAVAQTVEEWRGKTHPEPAHTLGDDRPPTKLHLYTDFSAGPERRDGPATQHHAAHAKEAPPPQKGQAPPQLENEFWLWMHWDTRRPNTPEGFVLPPGWYLCYAKATHWAPNQEVQRATLHTAHYPDRKVNGQTRENPHLRAPEYQLDRDAQPPRPHTSAPLKLQQIAGMAGVIDTNKGYEGRHVWRHHHNGNAATTMQSMPRTPPSPTKPTTQLRDFKEAATRELAAAGTNHLRALAGQDATLWQLLQKRQPVDAPNNKDTVWQRLLQGSELTPCGLTVAIAVRWAQTAHTTAKSCARIRTQTATFEVDQLDAQTVEPTDMDDEVAARGKQVRCECGLVFETSLGQSAHAFTEYQQNRQVHRPGAEHGTYGRGAWMLWSEKSQKVLQGGAIITPSDQGVGAQSGIGETVTQTSGCNEIRQTIAALAQKHKVQVDLFTDSMATQQQQHKMTGEMGPLDRPFTSRNLGTETGPGAARLLHAARTKLAQAGATVTAKFTHAAHDLHRLADWSVQDFGNAAADLAARLAVARAHHEDSAHNAGDTERAYHDHGNVRWVPMANGTTGAKAVHKMAAENTVNMRAARCTTTQGQPRQNGATGPLHVMLGNTEGATTANVMNKLHSRVLEAVQRAQLGELLGNYCNMASTYRGPMKAEVRRMSTLLQDNSHTCAFCQQPRTTNAQIDHVRYHCPALKETRQVANEGVCAMLWTLGTPYWWDTTRAGQWPKAHDGGLPPWAGTPLADEQGLLLQRDGSKWPRQFIQDHVCGLRKATSKEWTKADHDALTTAVTAQTRGTGSGPCWQIQAPLLQWFKQQYDLTTQADVNVFTKRSAVFDKAIHADDAATNTTPQPHTPGVAPPVPITASWPGATFVITNSAETPLHRTARRAHNTVREGHRVCVLVLTSTADGDAGFKGINTAMTKAGGKHVLRLPPTTLEVHDAQGHIPSTPTTMRGESTTGQRRRQPTDHSEFRRWTWDAKQERPRPPTTCVHSGPTQRLRDGFWPGEAHVYLFTAPADAVAAPTDAELRELKERIHATGGPGTLNRSVSYDWAPNSKHQRSMHTIPTSSDSGDTHDTTIRAWQQHWTGTPDGAGQGHEHTIPPGHVPTSLHTWLHEIGVNSAERQAVKEKLGEVSAGEYATLEQEHARHANTVLRRCGTDPNHDTGKDTIYQCPGARQGCAQWTIHLWKPNNATHEGVCYSCALHAYLQRHNRANRTQTATTNTPTRGRRQTATTSRSRAPHHTGNAAATNTRWVRGEHHQQPQQQQRGHNPNGDRTNDDN